MDVFCFLTSHFLLIPDDIFGLCIIKRVIMQNSCIIALFQSQNTVEKYLSLTAVAHYHKIRAFSSLVTIFWQE